MDFGENSNEVSPEKKTTTKLSKTDTLKINTKKSFDSGIIEVDQKTGKVFHRDSIYKASEIRNNSENLNQLILKITTFKNYNLKNPLQTSEVALRNLGYKNNNINRYLYEKAKNLKSNDVLREVGDYLLGKLPFLIFLSIPFIAMIFWITFFDKTLNYTDHLVFSYSFYSFLFICLILFELIGFISEDVAVFLLGLGFTIIFPVYLYKSLLNFYQKSHWKTIFKFILLNLLFIPFSVLAILVLLSMSVILF